MLMMLGRLGRATCRAADAHVAAFAPTFGAAGQHAGQLMLMMLGRLLGRLGLQGNMQGS